MDTNSFLDITIEDFDESDFCRSDFVIGRTFEKGSAHKQILSEFSEGI